MVLSQVIIIFPTDGSSTLRSGCTQKIFQIQYILQANILQKKTLIISFECKYLTSNGNRYQATFHVFINISTFTYNIQHIQSGLQVSVHSMVFNSHPQNIETDAKWNEEFKDDVRDDEVEEVLDCEPSWIAYATTSTTLTIPINQLGLIII